MRLQIGVAGMADEGKLIVDEVFRNEAEVVRAQGCKLGHEATAMSMLFISG